MSEISEAEHKNNISILTVLINKKVKQVMFDFYFQSVI